MRIVRNVFYLSGALIGVGLLLYFAITVIVMVSLGGFDTGRTSLPRPTRLSTGGSYTVIPDCPVTLLGTTGLFSGLAFARIKSGNLGAASVPIVSATRSAVRTRPDRPSTRTSTPSIPMACTSLSDEPLYEAPCPVTSVTSWCRLTGSLCGG